MKKVKHIKHILYQFLKISYRAVTLQHKSMFLVTKPRESKRNPVGLRQFQKLHTVNHKLKILSHKICKGNHRFDLTPLL